MKSLQTGYSAIQLIVIIAIIGILLGVATVSFLKFRQQQALEHTTDAIVSMLGEARAKTLAGYGNTSYGVRIEAAKIVLFTGTVYSANAATNKNIPYETGVSLETLALNGGGSNVSFDRLKGTTSQYGTIIVQSSNGQTRTIIITSTGTVKRN